MLAFLTARVMTIQALKAFGRSRYRRDCESLKEPPMARPSSNDVLKGKQLHY
jgi:hypothetical protein